ncbi:hypothetical protein BBJ28_00015191 [Nothophytophthora sp. Chile5]|nr:hypothetical protein BBJ28_00015191 [Nothophytophthora sp. Chile5]
MLVDISSGEASLLATAGIALAALLTAWNANANGFVWDDRSAVLANDDVKGSAWTELFTHDFWGRPIRSASSHKSYRPLTVLSFRLNYMLAGGHDAWTYHATNTLVHAACAVLVWRVASLLFAQHRGRRSNKGAKPAEVVAKDNTISMGALTAGLLFAVHPIHCDAVASIVGRADLLCTMLSLWAFLVYARGRPEEREGTRWSHVMLALVLAIAAGLCKELGFTTFGLLIAYDLLQIPHHRQVEPTLRSMKLRLAVTVAVGIPVAALRVWINGEHRHMKWHILANNVAVQDGRLSRTLSYAHLHAWYLWKLVWPRWLCFDYGYNTVPVIEGLADARNAYTLLAYTVVGVGVCSAVRQFTGSRGSPLLLMSIAFGAIPFIPASNVFFPVGTVVAERLLYFPSVGFCLLIGCIVDQALAITKKHAYHPATRIAEDASSPAIAVATPPRKRAAFNLFGTAERTTLICGALLLTTGCYRSRVRNAEWASEVTLFDAAVRVVPSNAKVLSNAAKNLLNSNPQQAIEYLQVAVGLLPDHIEAHSNLGLAFVSLASSATASKSNDSDALFLHGVRHLHKSATFGPTLFPAPGFLGGELFTRWMQKNRRSGQHSLEKLLASQSVARAIRFLDRAVEQNSFYPVHYYNRGSVAYEIGDLDVAINFFRATERANAVVRERQLDLELLVQPSSIYNMLAVCYRKKGMADKALELLQQGIGLYPEETDMYVNAAMILAEHGEHAASDAQLQAGLVAATERSHISKLRRIAKILQAQALHHAAEAYFDRAKALEHEYS